MNTILFPGSRAPACIAFTLILSVASDSAIGQDRTDGWVWKSASANNALTGMRCAYADATKTFGMGLRRPAAPNPSELFIYLDGGGSCYDSVTCFGANGDDGSTEGAAHVRGYGKTDFDKEPMLESNYLSSSAENPFSKMNMAYVPYCTGDTHGGTRSTGFISNAGAKPIYFVGQINFEKVLNYLKNNFGEVKQVWLMGSSAGGGGANRQYSKVVAKFPGAHVHLIEDSSPGFPNPVDDARKTTNWGVEAPCKDSCDSVQGIRLFNRSLDPASRFAMISFSVDPVTIPWGWRPSDFIQSLGRYNAEVKALNPQNSRSFTADNATYINTECRPESDFYHVVTRKTFPEALKSAHLDFLRRMLDLQNSGPPWVDVASGLSAYLCPTKGQ